MRVRIAKKVDLLVCGEGLLLVFSRYRRETAVFADGPSHCCLLTWRPRLLKHME
jgi:hypothetical protein